MAGGTYAMSARDLADWAVTARPGDETIYARGERLPRGADVGPRAQALHAAGVIGLVQRKVDGSIQYIAQRTRQPVCCARDLPAPVTDADALAEQDAVLIVLRRYAHAGRPCPANRQIAHDAALKDGERARYRMRQLRDRGVIAVEEVAAEPRRVVTIVATGKRTGTLS